MTCVLFPQASVSSVQHSVWLPASIDSFNSLMETERMTVSPAPQPPTADQLHIPEGGVPMPHPLSSPPSSTQSASMVRVYYTTTALLPHGGCPCSDVRLALIFHQLALSLALFSRETPVHV
jgi:hypothetical protein